MKRRLLSASVAASGARRPTLTGSAETHHTRSPRQEQDTRASILPFSDRTSPTLCSQMAGRVTVCAGNTFPGRSQFCSFAPARWDPGGMKAAVPGDTAAFPKHQAEACFPSSPVRACARQRGRSQVCPFPMWVPRTVGPQVVRLGPRQLYLSQPCLI